MTIEFCLFVQRMFFFCFFFVFLEYYKTHFFKKINFKKNDKRGSKNLKKIIKNVKIFKNLVVFQKNFHSKLFINLLISKKKK